MCVCVPNCFLLFSINTRDDQYSRFLVISETRLCKYRKSCDLFSPRAINVFFGEKKKIRYIRVTETSNTLRKKCGSPTVEASLFEYWNSPRDTWFCVQTREAIRRFSAASGSNCVKSVFFFFSFISFLLRRFWFDGSNSLHNLYVTYFLAPVSLNTL